MSPNNRDTSGRRSGNIKTINTKRKTRLYWYRNTLNASNLRGRNAIKSQCPSNGGTGKRLNTANKIFKKTIKLNNSGIKGEEKTSGIKRRVRPNKAARAKLERGPAIATLTGPYLRSLSAVGSYGTGLAYPTMNGERAKNKINGNRIDPNISRWRRGFKLKRPAFFAVMSPKLYAVAPWLTSWITTE